MKRIIIDNASVVEIKTAMTTELNEYAAYRKRNVEKLLESPAYAALLVEKHAIALSESVKSLFFDQENFQLDYDQLCMDIDREYKKNLYYRNRMFVKLDFSPRQEDPTLGSRG